MTFCHSGTVCVEQIIVGEDVHAVIMAVKQTLPDHRCRVQHWDGTNKRTLTRDKRARPTSGAPPSA